eukprot:2296379-Amphidinium_carterae.1
MGGVAMLAHDHREKPGGSSVLTLTSETTLSEDRTISETQSLLSPALYQRMIFKNSSKSISPPQHDMTTIIDQSLLIEI